MATDQEHEEAKSRYFNPRNGISTHFGGCRLRPNTRLPSFQSCSERVPTGQSQEQKAFLSRRLISMKAINRTIAAGWIAGTRPMRKKYFVFIKPAMGSQPSAPAGLGTLSPVPPRSQKRTQRRNWIPANHSELRTATERFAGSFGNHPSWTCGQVSFAFLLVDWRDGCCAHVELTFCLSASLGEQNGDLSDFGHTDPFNSFGILSFRVTKVAVADIAISVSWSSRRSK